MFVIRKDTPLMASRRFAWISCGISAALVCVGCRTGHLGGLSSWKTPPIVPESRPHDVIADEADDSEEVRTAGASMEEPRPIADSSAIDEPRSERGGLTRFLDRFSGPKRQPLPLTKSETGGDEMPSLANTDPFGEH